MIDNTTKFHADGGGLETASWEVGEPGQMKQKKDWREAREPQQTQADVTELP